MGSRVEEITVHLPVTARSSNRAALDHEMHMQCPRGRYVMLSRRETEVTALVVSGLLNNEVAFEPGISEITVKAHRVQGMRRMKASSLAELVNTASSLDIKLRVAPIVAVRCI